MQRAPTTSAILPVPEIHSDEPVVVIPAASVAPLDGPPDGERINIYTLAPKSGAPDFLGDMRERVLRKPFTSAAVAFTLGFFLARMTR